MRAGSRYTREGATPRDRRATRYQNASQMSTAERKVQPDEHGFTLVEVLVVVLILGLLAAIAIPGFFNQRDKGKDAAAKTGARTARTAIETYSVDRQGSYVGATVARLRAIEPSLPDAPAPGNPRLGLELFDANGSGSPSADGYRVTVTSTSGNTFSIADDAGTVTYPCTTVTSGGCVGATWD